jgi:large conductance mechanosensitive channel
MNKFIKEFQEFAFKGNMIDLAVGVVIGGAFGGIISAFVKDMIMPLVALATLKLKVPPDYQQWQYHGFLVGDLLSQMLNFFIVALVVFIVIVKIVGGLMKKAVATKAKDAPSEPVVKECPKCLSTIPIKAIKCAHCTADLVLA